MNPLHLPWLELAIASALLGAPLVGLIRDPGRAHRWCLAFSGAALACSLMAWWAFASGVPPEAARRYTLQPTRLGRPLFALDGLSGPLVPSIALLHFLFALSTARAFMRRFAFTWSLAAEAIALASFSTRDPWTLIALMAMATLPPYLELVNRRRPARLYLIHMSVFVPLMVVGWAIVVLAGTPGKGAPWWAILPLLVAVLIRCGAAPAHCWVTDWFEHASPGIAVLFVGPLAGAYAMARLVLPVSPGWVLQGVAVLALVTSLYAAGMATIQVEARRFFAFLFLSHASLVLVGLGLHSELALTGAFCLWSSAILSLSGLGLILRALEARFGRLSLASYHGLYEHVPTLAVFFLLAGLATVGYPGTIGFIPIELLTDGAVESRLLIGVGILMVSSLNGIAVLRAYFRLFSGARYASTIDLGIKPRERIAVLILASLIIAGGLFPQPWVESRSLAAGDLLHGRLHRGLDRQDAPPGDR